LPLKAVVDGETVIAPDLSDEEWAGLQLRHKKGLTVTMACCGAPGHLRTSGKGTRHFYHAPDSGCRYAEESKEHLEIKYKIYQTCQSENWETSVEFPSPDRAWISDVYAVRDGRKVVFEVQVSAITPEELEERDRKYRVLGIESYWLLDNFLGKSRDFTAWYDSFLAGEDGRSPASVPYIDPSLFSTGPENHIFIPRGIRSVGLSAKSRTLFTTNNPSLSLPVWVREVLKGNYQRYLEAGADAFHRKRQLVTLAAPALIRFREFYETIIRHGTYRERAGRAERRFRAGPSRDDPALQKMVRTLSAEIDWVGKEYRSYVSESSGLFTWKKVAAQDRPLLYFRLEPASNVKKIQDGVATMDRWEASFEDALRTLERGSSPGNG